MEMKVDRVVVGEIETNCYIVTCLKTGKSLVIDPGDDYPKILRASSGREISLVLNTHGHIDHIKEDGRFGLPVYIHTLDRDCLRDPSRNLSALLGFAFTVDPEVVGIGDGDQIRLGELTFLVIHTPGHTLGSVSFLAGGVLFSGDTLFCGDRGRTDLPGGSEEEICASITEKLLPLPMSTLVYPGHGPETSIGAERKLWDGN